MRSRSLIAALIAVSSGSLIHAAPVTFTAGDTLGQSSFNSGLHWSDALAPSVGKTYEVSISVLRTPADGNSYTFGGDSLTIKGPNGDFGYKGTGSTGVITVNNLILDGGLIRHINGAADVFNLAGNLKIASDSQIYAKQGLIKITATISGSAKITNPGSDGDGRVLQFASPLNTYTGSVVNLGRFEQADDARMNFVIGSTGVNNNVSGTGADVFNGDFYLDLTNASANPGDSWTLVSAANKSFSSTFTVAGFTETNNVWSNGTYSFDEATGVLSVVPEPATSAVVALVVSGMLARRRRLA